MQTWVVCVALLLLGAACGDGEDSEPGGGGGLGDSPILFVTQVPVPHSFGTIGSTFGNHLPDVDRVPRGGALWLRYADGSVRNLTAEAGFGNEGFQGADAIAVREPAVHWDGERAVFSMVVGAPTRQFQQVRSVWQLYEVTGLGPDDTAVITRVPGQPDYNNLSPIYDADDRIVFTSDRPRDGAAHLYPQLDEYEMAPTTTGLWRLDPASGDLRLLEHAPSGSFSPSIDSFGRVIFTRWDHLQRDQQSDGVGGPSNAAGTFDYADESADAARTTARVEVFPEPRPQRTDLLAGTGLSGNRFNSFLPWQIEQDGTGEETLAHLGRHELHGYIDRARTDDPGIAEHIAATSGRRNGSSVLNVFDLREDPTRPGTFVAVDAPEFETNTAGMLFELAAPPDTHADAIEIRYLTHPDTAGVLPDDAPRGAGNSGKYRDPVWLSTGGLIAAHADEPRADRNEGTRTAPRSRYQFRLRLLERSGDYWGPGPLLTGGLSASVTYWTPDELASYDGPLWELDPVEVRPRERPAARRVSVPGPEAEILAELGIDAEALRAYLAERDLALIVSRDVTSRDALDRQQPYNLRVPGGVESVTGDGRVYDVSHLQVVQADQLRGWGGVEEPQPGRRVLARVLHERDALAENPAAGVPGAVAVAPDGSVAAFVPAGRALSWQLLDPHGAPVVRERYWISFQPGEIRVCASCHGLSSVDQLGRGEPDNPPEALRSLLRSWRERQ